MLKVKTSTGFECKIDENVLNKYKFVKLLGKIEKAPQAVPELIEMLLGEQEEKMIEHLGGDPDAEQIAKEIGDIFNAIKEHNEAKKS